jgi:hypothetical protein
MCWLSSILECFVRGELWRTSGKILLGPTDDSLGKDGVMRRFARVVATGLLALLLAGCSVVAESRPDATQRDAWTAAVWEGLPRATSVAVEGPDHDGFTTFTSVIVGMPDRKLARSDVDAVVDHLRGATREGNGDLHLRIEFFSEDARNASGIEMIHLTDLVDPGADLSGSDTTLIIDAGDPAS